jgi:hypothetical protein
MEHHGQGLGFSHGRHHQIKPWTGDIDEIACKRGNQLETTPGRKFRPFFSWAIPSTPNLSAFTRTAFSRNARSHILANLAGRRAG